MLHGPTMAHRSVLCMLAKLRQDISNVGFNCLGEILRHFNFRFKTYFEKLFPPALAAVQQQDVDTEAAAVGEHPPTHTARCRSSVSSIGDVLSIMINFRRETPPPPYEPPPSYRVATDISSLQVLAISTPVIV